MYEHKILDIIEFLVYILSAIKIFRKRVGCFTFVDWVNNVAPGGAVRAVPLG